MGQSMEDPEPATRRRAMGEITGEIDRTRGSARSCLSRHSMQRHPPHTSPLSIHLSPTACRLSLLGSQHRTTLGRPRLLCLEECFRMPSLPFDVFIM
jgi:hypothetical protein